MITIKTIAGLAVMIGFTVTANLLSKAGLVHARAGREYDLATTKA